MKCVLAVVVLAACTSSELPPPSRPQLTVAPEAVVDAMSDAPLVIEDRSSEVWLRGSTHVHAAPSGDSSTPVTDVVRWYETRGYDFVVITDHNRISELDAWAPTVGAPTLRDPGAGLIVFSGIELTYNPTGCLPAGDATGKCRIHVNLLGPTGRFAGRLEWADRKAPERVAKYQAALDQQKRLGGIAQLNHPQWHWGMTPEVLIEVARRGMTLLEIANVQFADWNLGDVDHPSTEALWDAALAAGATLWGVATDDAHDYGGGGRYPAGGAWITVRSRREPQAILDAITAGRFYASTGVTLARAEVIAGELVVEVAPEDASHCTIDFIENGRRIPGPAGRIARRAVPPSGYVRAVVTRTDGKQAWIQPARRP